MTHPLEIITIMQHYNVKEFEHFTDVINGVRYWFKIMDFQLFISIDRMTWQPSENVLYGVMYGENG
jgi:hypothetical protein